MDRAAWWGYTPWGHKESDNRSDLAHMQAGWSSEEWGLGGPGFKSSYSRVTQGKSLASVSSSVNTFYLRYKTMVYIKRCNPATACTSSPFYLSYSIYHDLKL